MVSWLGTTYLVEGRKYVVRKLYLRDRSMTHGRDTDAEACDSLLAQRRVKNPLSS